jgi:hypothetical protein
MKHIIKVLLILVIFSCGKDKTKTIETETEKAFVYSFEIEGVYEKNDSIVLFYQKDGYIQYESPISQTVTGSNLSQKITFNLPEKLSPESFNLTVSTNKMQDFVIITGLNVLKDGKKVLDGTNYLYNDYFLTDESFTWNTEKAYFNLNHNNKYPPSFVGSDKLKDLLISQ